MARFSRSKKYAPKSKPSLNAGLIHLFGMAVIGLNLSIPLSLWFTYDLLVQSSLNTDLATVHFQVFMEKNVLPDLLQDAERELSEWTEITAVQLIAPEQALTEFEHITGIQPGNLTSLGAANPFPPVLTLETENQGQEALELIARRLQSQPGVAWVDYDAAWAQQSASFMRAFAFIIALLGALMAFATLLLVQHDIALTIRQQELTISLLLTFGASHRFIIRPLLRLGIRQTVGAAVLALLIAMIMRSIIAPVIHIWLIDASVSHLSFHDLSIIGARWVLIIFLAALAGTSGAAISAMRHLRRLEQGLRTN